MRRRGGEEEVREKSRGGGRREAERRRRGSGRGGEGDADTEMDLGVSLFRSLGLLCTGNRGVARTEGACEDSSSLSV